MVGSFIYAVGGFIEAIIGLRFVLRLMGANPENGLVSWIYQWSNPFVAPFAEIFGQNTAAVGPGVVTTSMFDWTALIAFVVIGIILTFLARMLYHPRATV